MNLANQSLCGFVVGVYEVRDDKGTDQEESLCTQDTHISCCHATGLPCFIIPGPCASCCSLYVT